MRQAKTFLMASAGVLLLTMTASMAGAAPGVSLKWDACLGDGGTTNRNFACNTNVGAANRLIGSFELGSDLNRVSGIACVVDLATASPALPEWWEFKNVGACRQLALGILAHEGTTCHDWAMGTASMNIVSYDQGMPSPNAARTKILSVLVVPEAQDLTAGQEYTAFALRISNAGTLGTTCTGCQVAACIVFNSIQIDTDDLTSTFLSGPANQTDSHYATWQGGAGVTVPARGDGCPAATPTNKSTWSQVKSLYR